VEERRGASFDWKGPRVYVRYPRESDRRAFLTLRRESEAFLAPWEPTPPPGNQRYNDATYDKILAIARTDRRHGLFIVRREDDVLLGGIHFNEVVRGAFQSCYLGYWIGAPYARQGYMGEALKLGLSFAFEQLELHRVEANVIPQNAASMALVERLGFRREGLSERYLKIAGSWEDHVRWAMTSEEWGRERG